MPSIEGLALEGKAINEIERSAVDGSGEDAQKLALHYLIARNEINLTLRWALISVENGNPSGEYLSGFLLKDEVDSGSRRRAVFWLKKAAAQGNDEAVSLLKEVHKDND